MKVIHKANRFRSDFFSQLKISFTTLTKTSIEGTVVFNPTVLNASPNQWNKIIGWTTEYFNKKIAYETILAYRVYPNEGELEVGTVRRFADGKFHMECVNKKTFTDSEYLTFNFDIKKSDKEYLPATPWAGGSVKPSDDFYYEIKYK